MTRIAAAAVLLAACGPSVRPSVGIVPSPSADPGACLDPLQHPSALPGDFTWRQRLVARARGETRSFEAVVEKRGDVLVVVGLLPGGTRAFSVRQDGAEVEADARLPKGVPFAPRCVLLDLQRVFFPLPSGAAAAGTSETRDAAGRLESRTFRLSGAEPEPAPAEVRVRYERWSDDGAVPLLATLEHRRYGYALTVETVSFVSGLSVP